MISIFGIGVRSTFIPFFPQNEPHQAPYTPPARVLQQTGTHLSIAAGASSSTHPPIRSNQGGGIGVFRNIEGASGRWVLGQTETAAPMNLPVSEKSFANGEYCTSQTFNLFP